MTTAPAYDLLLTGGTLLDPAQGIHQRRDIAFKDGLVAEVAERIDAAAAVNSVDVAGKLITPGLIPASAQRNADVISATSSSRE